MNNVSKETHWFILSKSDDQKRSSSFAKPKTLKNRFFDRNTKEQVFSTQKSVEITFLTSKNVKNTFLTQKSVKNLIRTQKRVLIQFFCSKKILTHPGAVCPLKNLILRTSFLGARPSSTFSILSLFAPHLTILSKKAQKRQKQSKKMKKWKNRAQRLGFAVTKEWQLKGVYTSFCVLRAEIILLCLKKWKIRRKWLFLMFLTCFWCFWRFF